MLVSPHIAAGVALGSIIGNGVVVVPVAIASHFLLDSVPHWQETLAPYKPTKKTYIRIPIDFAIGLFVIIFALQARPDHALSIWLGAIFASGPDLDVVVIAFPNLKRGLLSKYWDWHCKIQRETASLWGLLPQIAVIALSLIIIQIK